MTKNLDGHLFKTLNKKKLTPKQRSYYSERHTLSRSLFAPDLSITDNQGQRTAGRLFSLWGGLYSDRSGGNKFRQSGVSGAQTRDFRHVVPFRGFKAVGPLETFSQAACFRSTRESKSNPIQSLKANV